MKNKERIKELEKQIEISKLLIDKLYGVIRANGIKIIVAFNENQL